MKVGTTALVLAMIEDDAGPTRDLSLADPVRALHQVSADLSLARPAGPDRRVDGDRARDAVGALRRRPASTPRSTGWRALGDDGRWARWSSSTGRRCSRGLESDPSTLADTLDWVAKRELLLAYRDRHGCGWEDPRLAALALQYHDLRPDKSRLPAAWACARWSTDARWPRRSREPPPGTQGLVPGQVPGPLARRRRHRQLGLPGVRHRRRSAAARPYDGSPEGNGRAHRCAAGREHRAGGSAQAAELLGEHVDDSRGRRDGTDGRWQNRNRRRRAQRDPLAPRWRRRSRRPRPAASERGEKIKAELDDLLDEIDEVLEDNAEEFVRNYVQKGGQ